MGLAEADTNCFRIAACCPWNNRINPSDYAWLGISDPWIGYPRRLFSSGQAPAGMGKKKGRPLLVQPALVSVLFDRARLAEFAVHRILLHVDAFDKSDA